MFKLEMDTVNAAFADGERGAEIARILRVVAKLVEAGGSIPDGDTGKLRDVNGNTVGLWIVSPQEDEDEGEDPDAEDDGTFDPPEGAGYVIEETDTGIPVGWGQTRQDAWRRALDTKPGEPGHVPSERYFWTPDPDVDPHWGGVYQFHEATRALRDALDDATDRSAVRWAVIEEHSSYAVAVTGEERDAYDAAMAIDTDLRGA